MIHSVARPRLALWSHGPAPKALERYVRTSANLYGVSTNKSDLGLASVCLLSGRERVLPKMMTRVSVKPQTHLSRTSSTPYVTHLFPSIQHPYILSTFSYYKTPPRKPITAIIRASEQSFVISAYYRICCKHSYKRN